MERRKFTREFKLEAVRLIKDRATKQTGQLHRGSSLPRSYSLYLLSLNTTKNEQYKRSNCFHNHLSRTH